MKQFGSLSGESVRYGGSPTAGDLWFVFALLASPFVWNILKALWQKEK